ncbi:MAG: Rpn family recombination-promoting nuclease/putative transposase [Bacteroidota bacterium]
MSKKNHKPHDRFIRKVLSNRKVVKQYIQQFVPKQIVERLDFRTLKSSPNSFVDEKLEEHISDIVYHCDWKKQGTKSRRVRISFLLEHKSYLPQYPHLQLLRYLLDAWENDVAEKKPLTLTIPIILYHGKKKWNYQSFAEYFELPDEALRSFIPQFEYLLTDLS